MYAGGRRFEPGRGRLSDPVFAEGPPGRVARDAALFRAAFVFSIWVLGFRV